MTPSVQRADPPPLLNLNKAPVLLGDTSSQVQPLTGNPGLLVKHMVHRALPF